MSQSVQEDRSTAQQGVEKVQETAQQAAGQVREQAGELRGKAGQRVREELDSRSTEAASQLRSAAGAMRRTGEQLRGEGNDASARMTDAIADRAERLGTYLEQADTDRLVRDVENFARRQPWLVALGGFAVGLIGSRFVKASSARRYETGNGAGGYHGAGTYSVGQPMGELAPGTAVGGGVSGGTTDD